MSNLIIHLLGDCAVCHRESAHHFECPLCETVNSLDLRETDDLRCRVCLNPLDVLPVRLAGWEPPTWPK